MKTVNIKGKEYVEVSERVIHLRENFEYHKIITEMISNENGLCIFKAMILNGDNEIVSTGHAYEKEGAGYINKTSYIENCETSAIGRALGFLGIGIEGSIASANEVKNAIDQHKKIDFNITALKDKAKLVNLSEKDKAYFDGKLPTVDTQEKYNACMAWLNTYNGGKQ